MHLDTARRYIKGYKSSAQHNGFPVNRAHLRRSLRQLDAYFAKNPDREPMQLSPASTREILLRIHAYWLTADQGPVEHQIDRAAAKLNMSQNAFWKPFTTMTVHEEKDWKYQMFYSRPDGWMPQDSEAFITQALIERKPVHGTPKPKYDLSGTRDTPPVPCAFRVGDKVTYINDAGLKFPNYTVLAFAHKIESWGGFIYLDKSSWWFPVAPEQLRHERQALDRGTPCQEPGRREIEIPVEPAQDVQSSAGRMAI